MDQLLETVREAPSILEGIRRARSVADAAGRAIPTPGLVATLDAAIDDPTDTLTAIAAVHALGRLAGREANDRLIDRLGDGRAFVREHATWGLAGQPRAIETPLVEGLVAAIREGGLNGMLAQLAVERFSLDGPSCGPLTPALVRAIERTSDPTIRTRLVETLGLTVCEAARDELIRIALRPDEPDAVRRAAIAAIGDRPTGRTWDMASRSSRAGGPVVDQPCKLDPGNRGLRIAQPYLLAELDPELTTVGAGDSGGIATLLVRLGDALVCDDRVDGVVTISRGAPGRTTGGTKGRSSGHTFVGVLLDARAGSGLVGSWESLMAARRGIRRTLRAQAPIDVVHLRMADVGSLAASLVAKEEGIPTVFSLAPDPHALIDALDRSGSLTRAAFGAYDADHHAWFRIRLVERLANEARRIVLFPRPELPEQLRLLLGIDVPAAQGRFAVVPEGIDLSLIATARTAMSNFGPADADGPDGILAGLSPGRRGLPLIVSVGRLHHVKGMARVVEAWATSPDLRARANLVIVGGDLDHPSEDERAELDRIREVLAIHPDAADGLVLAGHRSNAIALRLLVAADRGLPGLAAPGGVYVCGSRKEEFGLAIVEALASGLPVVAPAAGGPPTYVEDGVTGVLVDTEDRAALAAGIARALDLAPVSGRAERASRLVRERYTIDAMASAMVGVYAGIARGVSAASTQTAVATRPAEAFP